jgi:hypothetical protein
MLLDLINQPKLPTSEKKKTTAIQDLATIRIQRQEGQIRSEMITNY